MVSQSPRIDLGSETGKLNIKAPPNLDTGNLANKTKSNNPTK